MVAELVAMSGRVWVTSRPSVWISAVSTCLPGSIRIGMLICWVVGPPGLKTRAWLVTAAKSPAAAEAEPDREVGRAAGGGRVEILVGAVTIKKKTLVTGGGVALGKVGDGGGSV